MIIEMLYNTLQNSEDYLGVIALEKKNLKKQVKELEKLAKITEQNGYQVEQLETDKTEKEIKLLEIEEETRKVRRVITRLKASISIMQDEEVEETEIEE